MGESRSFRRINRL